MNKIISKVIHTFSAFVVACALGALINGALVMLSYLIFTSPESHEIIDLYGSNNGLYFVTVTLLIGMVWYLYASL